MSCAFRLARLCTFEHTRGQRFGVRLFPRRFAKQQRAHHGAGLLLHLRPRADRIAHEDLLDRTERTLQRVEIHIRQTAKRAHGLRHRRGISDPLRRFQQCNGAQHRLKRMHLLAAEPLVRQNVPQRVGRPFAHRLIDCLARLLQSGRRRLALRQSRERPKKCAYALLRTAEQIHIIAQPFLRGRFVARPHRLPTGAVECFGSFTHGRQPFARLHRFLHGHRPLNH